MLYNRRKAPFGELSLKSGPGPPMTLGDAAAARVRFIVWRPNCSHQVEPDPAEMAARYGALSYLIAVTVHTGVV